MSSKKNVEAEINLGDLSGDPGILGEAFREAVEDLKKQGWTIEKPVLKVKLILTSDA